MSGRFLFRCRERPLHVSKLVSVFERSGRREPARAPCHKRGAPPAVSQPPSLPLTFQRGWRTKFPRPRRAASRLLKNLFTVMEDTACRAGLICEARRIWSHLLTPWPFGRPAEPHPTALQAGRTTPAVVKVQGVGRKARGKKLIPDPRPLTPATFMGRHSGERAIAPRHSVRVSGPTCEPNHYADLPSRLPGLAPSQARSG